MKDIQSMMLNLTEKRKGSCFTVKDITRHIICIYAATIQYIILTLRQMNFVTTTFHHQIAEYVS